MSIPYNSKIMNNGEYRPFHGYTILAMVVNNLKSVEEFLKSSPLSQYFSALPSESYHMTVYNIWCHGSRFLPLQKQWEKIEYDRLKVLVGEQQALKLNNDFINKVKGSKSYSWEWPYEVMHDSMNESSNICKENISEPFIVNVNLHIPNTISLEVIIDSTIVSNKLNTIKEKCTNIFEKDDSQMKYHITLGYRYKDIPDNMIDILTKEIEKMKVLISNLCNNKLILNPPDAYWFNSMKNYRTADGMFK